MFDFKNTPHSRHVIDYLSSGTPIIRNGQLSSLVTYTRTGDHTYIDADGDMKTAGANEAPIDYFYDVPMIPRYEATENLCPEPVTPYTGWNNVLATLSPADEDMLGYFTDGVKIASGGASWHRKNSDTITWTNGTTYCLSAFVKKGTSGRIGLVFNDGSNDSVLVGDIGDDLTVSTSLAGAVSYLGRKDFGDDFWVYYVLFTPNADSSNGRIGVGPSSNTAGNDITFYGCQFEEGSFPTPFTPSTRSAPTIKSDGTDFASFYNQNEGTIRIEFYQPYSLPTGKRLFQIDDGTSGNEISIWNGGSDVPIFAVGNNWTSQASIASSINSDDGNVQCIYITYKDNEFSIIQSNGNQYFDTSGTVAKTMSALNIGNRSTGDRGFSGHIKSLTYWPRVLTPTQIMATKEYVVGGDSYSTGQTDNSIGTVLEARGYNMWNTGVGGSTLEAAVSRLESLDAITKPVIFVDGSNNGYDSTIANDVARYQRAYDAAGGNIIILTPILHGNLYNTTQGQKTLDLSAALIAEFGTDIVIDTTAIARAESGASFTDATDASDAGYNDAAYQALFGDGTHMDDYSPLADAVEAKL